MRVLVTGMTSRTARFVRETAFPSLLARTITEMGHSVTMHVEHSSADSYDAVIAGIASPLAPVATYLVPVAQTVIEAQQIGNFAGVVVDDPDAGKITHGASSALRDPSRLERTFYDKRPGMGAYKESKSLQATVMSFIEQMASWSWDTVVWPGHAWSSDHLQPRGDFTSVPIDPTPTLMRLFQTRVAAEPHPRTDRPGNTWLVDTTYFPQTALDPSMQMTSYSLALGDGALSKIIGLYRNAYGIIQTNAAAPGWWTPAPSLAAAVNRIYIPDPAEARVLGEPFLLLPSTAEQLTMEDYELAVQSQRTRQEDLTWTRKTLFEALAGVLGR
jgi:hypothetical protein